VHCKFGVALAFGSGVRAAKDNVLEAAITGKLYALPDDPPRCISEAIFS